MFAWGADSSSAGGSCTVMNLRESRARNKQCAALIGCVPWWHGAISLYNQSRHQWELSHSSQEKMNRLQAPAKLAIRKYKWPVNCKGFSAGEKIKLRNTINPLKNSFLSCTLLNGASLWTRCRFDSVFCVWVQWANVKLILCEYQNSTQRRKKPSQQLFDGHHPVMTCHISTVPATPGELPSIFWCVINVLNSQLCKVKRTESAGLAMTTLRQCNH